MSLETTLNIVERQLIGMFSSMFEIGIRDEKTNKMLIRTWSSEILLNPKTISFLRFENSRKKHIYVRPVVPHSLTLIDDLTQDAIKTMKSDGFRPAVIVETSSNNYQAWLYHGRDLSPKLSTVAAQLLAAKYKGDPSSADYRHFGRLAGFTNPKKKYIGSNGYSPFSKLIQVAGKQYQEAGNFIAEVRDFARNQDDAIPLNPSLQFSQTSYISNTLKIDYFHNNSKYSSDLHRADLAYVIYALSHNIDVTEIKKQLSIRDLDKKGSDLRQSDYIKRTIQKAEKLL